MKLHWHIYTHTYTDNLIKIEFKEFEEQIADDPTINSWKFRRYKGKGSKEKDITVTEQAIEADTLHLPLQKITSICYGKTTQTLKENKRAHKIPHSKFISIVSNELEVDLETTKKGQRKAFTNRILQGLNKINKGFPENIDINHILQTNGNEIHTFEIIDLKPRNLISQSYDENQSAEKPNETQEMQQIEQQKTNDNNKNDETKQNNNLNQQQSQQLPQPPPAPAPAPTQTQASKSQSKLQSHSKLQQPIQENKEGLSIKEKTPMIEQSNNSIPAPTPPIPAQQAQQQHTTDKDPETQITQNVEIQPTITIPEESNNITRNSNITNRSSMGGLTMEMGVKRTSQMSDSSVINQHQQQQQQQQKEEPKQSSPPMDEALDPQSPEFKSKLSYTYAQMHENMKNNQQNNNNDNINNDIKYPKINNDDTININNTNNNELILSPPQPILTSPAKISMSQPLVTPVLAKIMDNQRKFSESQTVATQTQGFLHNLEKFGGVTKRRSKPYIITTSSVMTQTYSKALILESKNIQFPAISTKNPSPLPSQTPSAPPTPTVIESSQISNQKNKNKTENIIDNSIKHQPLIEEFHAKTEKAIGASKSHSHIPIDDIPFDNESPNPT